MPAQPLVLDPTRLHLLSLSADSARITLHMRTCSDTAPCPQCGRLSARVHSRYCRTLADLPWAGIPVRMLLWSRRFFCDKPDCPRRIFTERLPGIASPHARRTDRLRAWLVHLAFAAGGEPGARLLRHLGMTGCGDTVLAHLRAHRLPPLATPRLLSVDDFAFRRGRTYGSLLVDLERHQVVDLLPDRSGDQFAAWLVDHPGVEVISRDRSSEYARAAQQVAPQVGQVADRFHLVKNVRDVLFRIFKRHARLVRQVPTPRPGDPGLYSLTRLRVDRETSRERVRREMEERFNAIQRLAHEGMSKTAIARALGLNWQTVRKYLTYTTPPQRSYTVRQSSVLMAYQAYILGRWASGCHNTRQLWREIAAQGYSGGYRTLARLTGYLRQQERLGAALPAASVGMTPGQAAGLAVARPEKRSPREAEALAQLGSLHPQLRGALAHFSSFAALLRSPPDTLEAAEHLLREWATHARTSGIPEVRGFAAKLSHDQDAVVAALILPYSQGQTEGFITKLKLLKRSMYGRAKLDLLRARLLYAAR
jgi:transposase